MSPLVVQRPSLLAKYNRMAKFSRAITSSLAISLMFLTPSAWAEDMATLKATYEINLEDIMLDHDADGEDVTYQQGMVIASKIAIEMLTKGRVRYS